MTPGQWAACGVTGLLIAASLAVYAGYRDALSIDTEEVNTDAWGDRPVQVEGIHNILLLGVDTESEGNRPDVLVIVNVDVDRGAVTMVNLPRDLIVDIPRCDPVGDSSGWRGGFDQINHSMMYGGLDCLGNTVESTTDIHLDHMVMVDFAGFENIVDTVGGVELCIPEPLDDPKAHLQLEAGVQTLDGEQALGLARSRDSTEYGNDMGRIQSQQRLIGALLREVTSGKVLASPATLYDFLGSVTDSMVTDDGLSVDKMAELAIAMRQVDLSRMNMVMAPVTESRFNAQKLDLQQPEAGELFAAVAAGEVLPGDGEAEEGEGGGASAGEEPVEPADVSVRVLNGTGRNGLAAAVGQILVNDHGFVVTGTGNPGERRPADTTVYHGPGQRPHAEELASVLAAAQLEEVPGLGGELELVMGQDWEGVPGGDGRSGESGGEQDPLAALGATSAAEDTVPCD
ncbi:MULTISPECIES: LCP family protein [unclassified Nocardiopsis]|uniref:LCP family protein n=1 Tax=unclassified Nocardiopsis TaxID=2649073 RepID=UPI00135C3CD6|nr:MULTISPECIES: LCP family protein [unclassified Nocardiopsis]